MGRTGAGGRSLLVMDKIKTGLELLISAAISVLVLLRPPGSADTSQCPERGGEGGMDPHGMIWVGRDPEDHRFPKGRDAVDVLDVFTPRGAASAGAAHPNSLQGTPRDGPELVFAQGEASSRTSLPRGCCSEPEPFWRFHPGSYQLIKPWVSRCLSVGAVCSACSSLSRSPILPQPSQQRSRTRGRVSAPCPGLRGCPRAGPERTGTPCNVGG